MKIERRYSKAPKIGQSVLEAVQRQVTWQKVHASVKDGKTGSVVFESEVEVPAQWSQEAANIFAKMYLRKAGVPSITKAIKTIEGKLPMMPIWLRPSVPAKGAVYRAEISAKQVFYRLAGCWTYWGWRAGHIDTEQDAEAFYAELYLMLAKQVGAPNSPQWFNTGLHWAYGITGTTTGNWICDDGTPQKVENAYERPQPHACFIQPVADDLVNPSGMMDLWMREARLFKGGSGSGSNMSSIRGRGELLSGGGQASGLMSFLEVGDRSAGAIQSGGTTRRAALMRCLDLDHPEIEEFVTWKVREEAKAAAMAIGTAIMNKEGRNVRDSTKNYLDATEDFEVVEDQIKDAAAAGIPQAMIDRYAAGITVDEIDLSNFENEAVRTVSGQNSNNSVRVTNDFLTKVDADAPWELTARTDGRVMRTILAARLWDKIALSAWASADPGVQFHDTINEWHTCSVDGPIQASNPCFPGEVKVWTIDGPKRFDELAASGAPIPVLTELSDGELAYRVMERPRRTQTEAELIEITFKSNRGRRGNNILTRLRVTPNHEFFTSSGERLRAADLRPGDSIESAYRRKANQNYTMLRATNGDVVLEHHLIAEFDHGRRPVWPQEHGYHLDEIKIRNVSGNVVIVPGPKHNFEHMLGDRNPMRAWFGSLTPEEQAVHRRKMSATLTGAGNPIYGKKGHLSDRVWVNNGVKNRRVKPHELPEGWEKGRTRLRTVDQPDNHQFDAEQNFRNVLAQTADPTRKSNDVYLQFLKQLRDANSEPTEEDRAGLVAGLITDLVTQNSNHKVVGIKRLSEKENVYCGTVPSTRRFFVSLGDDDFYLEGVLVSNCSEYMFLDNTACNLASINLVTFKREDGSIDLEAFEHAVRLWTIVLDISVSMASYPSAEIALGSWKYRTLGLGYANAGGLLMRLGLPYDSENGRALIAGLTALKTGVAYRTSAEMAEALGPFPRYLENAEPMKRVLRNHARATCVASTAGGEWEGLTTRPQVLREEYLSVELTDHIKKAWESVLKANAFRNAQVTLLAPTGTISYVMDCGDFTGIEPAFSLLVYKSLSGGGRLTIVNSATSEALRKIGLETNDIVAAEKWLEEHGTLENFDNPIVQRNLAVFDCSMPAIEGGRFIDPMAHVKMVAAVQPFLSGAVSKTVNVPASTTVDDIKQIYRAAHQMGLKSVALYRDGCKLSQPLRVAKVETLPPPTPAAERGYQVLRELAQAKPPSLNRGQRERLPGEVRARRFKARVGGMAIYLITGEYNDGRLGEMFIELAREGSDVRGWANSWAKAVSIGLQYGVPIEEFVEAFEFTRFDPSGPVQGHARIKMCSSVPDLAARIVGVSYLGREDLANIELEFAGHINESAEVTPQAVNAVRQFVGRSCPNCHNDSLRRTGTCVSCQKCGYNEGCG